MTAAAASVPTIATPRGAWRMTLIGFLHFNMIIGAIWDRSACCSAVEAQLGIDRTASTMGVPLVTLVSADLASVLGSLLRRHSLRTMALTDAMLTPAGFDALDCH